MSSRPSSSSARRYERPNANAIAERLVRTIKAECSRGQRGIGFAYPAGRAPSISGAKAFGTEPQSGFEAVRDDLC